MDIVDSKSDEKGSRDRDEPVDSVFCRPAVPEQADGDKAAAKHQRRQTMLWLHLSVDSLLSLEVSVRKVPDGDLSDTEAETKAQISQSRLTRAKVVHVLKNLGESREQNVHVTVRDSTIKGHNEDNGRSDEEHNRSSD